MDIPTAQMVELVFKIGEVVVRLTSTGESDFDRMEENYKPFIVHETPQVCYDHSTGKIPNLDDYQECFNSGGVWHLLRRSGSWAISLQAQVYGSAPYRVAVLEEDFQHGVIISSQDYFTERPLTFPFQYPLPEVIMINLLSQGHGLLVHACAVKDGERGLLFCGTSGAGKSTTARIWGNQPGVTVLSDDRVLLYQKDQRYWISGTPWHGDVRAASPEKAPLEKIFVLQHASDNHFRPLEPAEVVSSLLVRSFPTYWSISGMDFSLRFLESLSLEVPAVELGFMPDERVIEYVRASF